MQSISETVSSATQRNWERLGTDMSTRLVSRANKRKSKKQFLPIEYCLNKSNIPMLQIIVDKALSSNWETDSVLYSVAVNLLKAKGIYCFPHVQTVLNEYSQFTIIREILEIEFPSDEFDLLGLIYQSLKYEGDKNIEGSYYTPKAISSDLVSNMSFQNGEKFLDPCCGSGSFLLSIKADNPDLLYGIDNDPIAVMLAKVNLLLKFDTIIFYPKVFCCDYLAGQNLLKNCPVFDETFEYIGTNPPWGAANITEDFSSLIMSKESFSCFFVAAYRQLKQNGVICFLMPEAILKIKVHRDIRSFWMNNGSIRRIVAYDGMFSGVTTHFYGIEYCNAKSDSDILYIERGMQTCIPVKQICENIDYTISALNSIDAGIISKFKKCGVFSLENSIWALGIVTGDNKAKLHAQKLSGMEEIFTGKEVSRYRLCCARKYILYDRTKLQQVAKEEYYRAPEKLVYKFVSDRLVFAYDNQKRLFLNSANILIPQIPHMSIKTTLAFLNSELYQFIYRKLFGDVKILKGNLLQLLFPSISEVTDSAICVLVDGVLAGKCSDDTEIQDLIYNLYSLTSEEINHIRSVVNGKTN